MARFGRGQPVNVYYTDDLTAFNQVDLTASTGAAASGNATLGVTAAVAGNGAAAVGSQVTLGFITGPINLAGQGSAATAGTALVIETARVAGTGTNANTGTATLAPILAIDGTGNVAASTTAALAVGPIPGYLAWYDAADLSTITTIAGTVDTWADKSGNGYDLTQPIDFRRPATGVRTIHGHNTISFDQTVADQGLTFAGLPLTSNVISVFVVAQFDSGNRLLSFTDGTQSDWDNTAGVAVLSLPDDGSYYNNQQITGTAAGFATIEFAYDLVRNDTDWTSRINGHSLGDVVTTEVGTTFNATDIGVGGIPFPPNLASGATGRVGEILVYNAALTQGQVAANELYLITKWFVRDTTLLTGHGDAADGSAGIITADEQGHGDATSGGRADLTVTGVNIVPIAGNGAASSAGTGPVIITATLTGQGTASSAITNTLRLLADLRGHGDAATADTNSLVLSAALAGHGDNSAAAATALLQVLLGLAGHGDGANTGTFDLIVRPVVVLAGSGANAANPTGLARLLADLRGHGDAASAPGTIPLFGAVPDPDPFTLTIHDGDHTDTIWDRGHTVTLVDSP